MSLLSVVHPILDPEINPELKTVDIRTVGTNSDQLWILLVWKSGYRDRIQIQNDSSRKVKIILTNNFFYEYQDCFRTIEEEDPEDQEEQIYSFFEGKFNGYSLFISDIDLGISMTKFTITIKD